MSTNLFEEQGKAVEVMPGMTVEKMTSVFFDKNALIEPVEKLYQLNSGGHRYYYRYDENGEPQFFPSVTTILSQTLPKPIYLEKWIAEQGWENAERYKNERASYGTFMHAQFEDVLINKTYDLDSLNERLKQYIERNKLPEDFIYHADELKKDVLAFAQFVIDYDVRPLAVEIALAHPERHYAGMIDLVCEMAQLPGSDKRILALIDFKSGRKSFYEAHEIQLHMYLEMWNLNFPQHHVERVYNFAPKDWKKAPSYHFTDQTDSINRHKIQSILDIAAVEDGKREKRFTHVSGVISIEKGATLTDNVMTLTLSDIAKRHKEKQEKPMEEEDEPIDFNIW